MKKISTVYVLFFFVSISFGQDSNSPKNVFDEFNKKIIGKLKKTELETQLTTFFSNCLQDPSKCNKSISFSDFEQKSGKVNFSNSKSVSFGSLDSIVTAMSDIYIKNNKINSAVDFSFDTSSSENQNQTNIGFGAKISKGTFPSKFNFESSLSVAFNNDKAIENLSKIFLSYDYFLDNNLRKELYFFSRRTGNNFLDIDYRYETGAGIIFNWFSGTKILKTIGSKDIRGKVLSKSGLKEIEKIKLNSMASEDDKATEILDELVAVCTDSACNLITDRKLISDYNKIRTKLKKPLSHLLNGIFRENSKWRLGFLVGINYELEASEEDTMISYRDSIREINFEPRNLVRIALAPIVEFSKGDLSFSSRCYYKLGISADDFKTNSVLNMEILDDFSLAEQSDLKLNYRLEWDNTLVIAINKNFSISASLNYQWVNSSQRQFQAIITDGVTDYQLFTSPNRFLNFKTGLKIKL